MFKGVLLGLLVIGIPALAQSADLPDLSEANASSQALIYYNRACSMCASMVDDVLPKVFQKHGIQTIEKKDYINQRQNRSEMNGIMNNLQIPFELQSHIMTFVKNPIDAGNEPYPIIIAGHVPQERIDEALDDSFRQTFKRIILYQDEMHENPENYKILGIPSYANTYVGEIMTYSTDTSIGAYAEYLESNKDRFVNATG